MPILILIFLGLWAWAELAVFIAIGSEVGALLTIIGIAVTAMVGLWLLKSQGRAIMASLQQKMARGEAPVASMADGAAIAAGAVLMLIPGYITDAMGLVLFIPGVRTIIGAGLIARMMRRGAGRFSFNGGQFGAGHLGPDILGPGPFLAARARQANRANRANRADRNKPARPVPLVRFTGHIQDRPEILMAVTRMMTV